MRRAEAMISVAEEELIESCVLELERVASSEQLKYVALRARNCWASIFLIVCWNVLKCCCHPYTMCLDAWRDSASVSKLGSEIALGLLFHNDLSFRERPWWNDQDSLSFFRSKPCFGVFIRSGIHKVVLASWRIQGRVRTRLVVSSVCVGSWGSRSHYMISRMSLDLIWTE